MWRDPLSEPKPGELLGEDGTDGGGRHRHDLALTLLHLNSDDDDGNGDVLRVDDNVFLVHYSLDLGLLQTLWPIILSGDSAGEPAG